MRKRHFTLIEVAVALSLISILMVFVLRFFTQSILLKNQFEEAQKTVIARKELQIRLNQMFSQLLSDSGEKPTLYLDKKGLHLICHNGTDIDPDYSGYTKMRLFVKKGNLYLEQTSLDSASHRLELLLKNVLSLNFSFCKKGGSVWENLLAKSEAHPSMMIMELCLPDNDNFKLAFFIPSGENSVIYFEKKT